MAHNLRPFRDYDEKDVINLYAYNKTAAQIATLDDAGTPITAGTLVELSSYTDGASTAHVGWDISQEDEMTGDVGQSVSNTVAQRHGIRARVLAVDTAGARALGMTLMQVREKDENGELLKFNPRKAAEMQAVLHGQAVPIVTRGIFLYESTGLNTTGGTLLYSDNAGSLSATAGAGKICAEALGKSIATTNAAGTSVYHTLIKLDCGLS